ncbi:DNA repair protein Rev1 [Ochlerotatus camptorhynchus]|uniref:DNA repair protein Rev1 n=1 Tax=Ochlerotatus camptorhynchus TaxID=644619 RepID=UPI0031DB5EE6
MKRKEKSESETGFEGWGDYMGAKISKLEDQFRHSAASAGEKLSDLFAGISIFVNGYTNPSSDELKRLMMQHGGIYHHYKRSTTTYTIASNLPDVKVKSITSEVIISPQWVVDCIEQKRIVDHSKYLLYSNHKPSQPKLAFGRLDKNVDIQKPVAKPDGKDDISKDEFMSLMSKLHVLNEKIKESASAEKKSSTDETKPLQEESKQNEIIGEAEIARMEEQVLSESTEVFDQNPTPEEPTTSKADVSVNDSKKPSPRKTMRATDPNFLAEFFNNSRLHHIATLGAGFKQYVGELRESHDGSFPERETLRRALPKSDDLDGPRGPFIMHIDMDCFFVSVGLRKHPHLRGQPVAVTHSKGSDAGKVQSRPGQNRSLEIELYQKRLEERYKTPDIPYESRLLNMDDNNSMSEVASCSYEARKMGVKNGMFVGSALKLCPKLKTIPYDFDGYREVAFTLYNTIARYTLNIEAVSCDEMFVDLTDLIQDIGADDVMDFVGFVREQIKESTGCPCSAGVGANRLQARMATKKAKPNGQYYLAPETVGEYMRDIPISELPGIGPSTTYRLKQLSWNTCEDLQMVSGAILQREFGKKFGDTIYQACRGIDERPLVYEQVRKSVSVDVNYGIRFKEEAEVERFMKQLSEEIHKRLNEIKKRGKLITVKLLVRASDAPVETAKFMGHGLCDIITKSCPLKDFTCDLALIERSVLALMKQIAAPPHELRGIGLQISKFEEKKAHTESKNSLKTMFEKAAAKQESAVRSEQPSVSKLEVTPTKIVLISAARTEVTPKRKSETTPKKLKPAAPKFGRGRGRPPKHLSLNKSKQSNDMLRFLKEGKADSRAEGIPEGLDAEFLAALPDEIRAEVIKDYKIQARSHKSEPVQQLKPREPSPKPSTSSNRVIEEAPSATEKISVDLKFLQALPPELRQEVERQIELQKDTMVITSSEPEFYERLQVTPESSPAKELPPPPESVETKEPEMGPNILLRADWRNMLSSWVDSADEPEDVDVDMIAANARELVDGKRLCEVHLALRFMFRILEERALCPWHQAYFRIVDAVQLGMLEVYRTKLAVNRDFGCGNADCCNAKE